jgi:hypothetical protein
VSYYSGERHRQVNLREERLVRRSVSVFIVSVALGLASTATADADQSQAGCQAYGGFVAAAVQANIPGGQVVSGIATSAPGAVAGFAASAKAATCP